MTDPRALTRFVRSFDIALAILDALHEPKSAKELESEIDVTLATIYRYLKLFDEAGMVRVEGKNIREQAAPDAPPTVTKQYIRTVDRLEFDLKGEAQAPDNLRYFEETGS